MNGLLVSLVAALALVLCVAVPRSAAQNEGYPIVYTRSGAIRGRQRMTMFNRKPYNSFEGIPYAKAPVGELRFKVCGVKCFVSEVNNGYFVWFASFIAAPAY